MQGADLLQTVAEVSVAFAGFTGVVLAFGRRADRPWSPMDVYRFRVLLGASLQALLLSLIPFLLHYAGASERTTWAASSFLVCLLLLVVTAVDLRYLGPIREQIPRADRLLGVGIGVGFVFVFPVQIANVLGAFTTGSIAAYLGALIYYLAMSSLMFLRLLAGVGLERD
jgi:hypothetical protein